VTIQFYTIYIRTELSTLDHSRGNNLRRDLRESGICSTVNQISYDHPAVFIFPRNTPVHFKVPWVRSRDNHRLSWLTAMLASLMISHGLNFVEISLNSMTSLLANLVF
jgi:hypothetical protein